MTARKLEPTHETPVDRRGRDVRVGSAEDVAVASTWDRMLTHAGWLAVAGGIYVLPGVFGGRHAWGQLFLSLSVAVGWFAVAIRGFLKTSTYRQLPILATFWWLACTALLCLQFLPLPESFVAMWSRPLRGLGVATESPATTAAGWRWLSLYPSESRTVAAWWVTLAGWSALVWTMAETSRDRARMTRWVAYSVAVWSTLGLAQFCFNNGKFFWCYEHPTRTTFYAVKGPFINENHFGHFALYGWWCWVSLVTARWRQRMTGVRRRPGGDLWSLRTLAGVMAMVIIALAIVLTRSKAVIALLVLTSVVAAWGLAPGAAWMKSIALPFSARRSRRTALTAAAAACVFLCGGGALLAPHAIGASLKSLAIGWLGASRVELWRADYRLLSASGWFGYGGGTHRWVYPIHYRGQTDVEFLYAENGYLQVALEYGVVGTWLLFILIGYLLWCVGSRSWRPSAARGTTAKPWLAAIVLLMLLAHGVVDFVWWIPACMTVAVAVLVAHSPRDTESMSCVSVGIRRWMGGLTSIALTVLLVAAAAVSWKPALAASDWQAFLRTEAHMKVDDSSLDLLEARRQLLQSVVRKSPQQPHAKTWLAELLVAEFEQRRESRVNSMSLADVRHAVRQAAFADVRACHSWLAAAIGRDVKLLLEARRLIKAARAESLVDGRASALAAQLCFLDGEGVDREAELWRQALRLCPLDVDLRLILAEDRLLSGDERAAWAHWRVAFRYGVRVRPKLYAMLVPRVGVPQFVNRIGATRMELKDLYRWCRQSWSAGAPEAGRAYVRATLAEGLSGRVSWSDWEDAVTCARQLRLSDELAGLAQAALLEDPYSPSAHRWAAEAALAEENWDNAARHIDWLDRFGDDFAAAERLRAALRRSRQFGTSPRRQSQSPREPAVGSQASPIATKQSRSTSPIND